MRPRHYLGGESALAVLVEGRDPEGVLGVFAQVGQVVLSLVHGHRLDFGVVGLERRDEQPRLNFGSALWEMATLFGGELFGERGLLQEKEEVPGRTSQRRRAAGMADRNKVWT